MSASSRKRFSFTKLLRLACAAFEIVVVLGLLAMAFTIPRLGSDLVTGEHVSISSDRGGDFTYGITRTQDKGVTHAPNDSGSLSIGPFALSSFRNSQFLSDKQVAPDITVQKVTGMVTFSGLAQSSRALAMFKGPAVLALYCAILGGLAYIELLRRLLLSAEKGDLFTGANVKSLRLFAFVLIVLGLIRFAAWQVLVTRMNIMVPPLFPDGTWMAQTLPSGKMTGVLTGLTFLLLAEVFSEGLKFRNDSDLTI
ncbi:MAG TPA: DUF2975 domain-containing protein [Opitutaceae bacterium]|jgi:hypothetical protein|nr:DUF2975 domain-containing protein [Opitutaceae bacterium]